MEGSTKMAGLAKENLKHQNTKITLGDIELMDFGNAPYDVVLSRLVFHYIEDLERLFKRIHDSLNENGELVFSIEHPVITSCYESYHHKSKRRNWIVDDYFNTGKRVNIWIGKKVVKYHKTLQDYWSIIKATNFEVIEMKESKPDLLLLIRKKTINVGCGYHCF